MTPAENCPQVRVRVWFTISVRIGAGGNFRRGQFSKNPLINIMIINSAKHKHFDLSTEIAHPIICCKPFCTFGKILRHMTCSFQFFIVFRGEDQSSTNIEHFFNA